MAAQWQCPCGFSNRATNDICGGKGPMGCNAPRELDAGEDVVESSYGPQRRQPQKTQRMDFGQPYDIRWQCSCGFSNKASNEMCGGAGPMGCKMPKQSQQMHQHMMKAFGQQMMAGNRGNENWQCTGCGFNNKPMNQVCGGQGPLGCKAPFTGSVGSVGTPQFAHAAFAPQAAFMSPMIQFAQKDAQRWSCACGFNNSPNNQVCGGNGPMGCNEPMPLSEVKMFNNSLRQQEPQWLCLCGFKNRSTNKQCGGNGPMGCSMERAECEVAE